eukprot:EC119099.1.p1 GENE.EC119099.1~~EC119099.1.p1  ORF type:complete len:122 (+),score=15.29 EC119099.1:91-456(+)
MYRLSKTLLSNQLVNTGWVGVPLMTNARDVFISKAQGVLEAVKVIPESAIYRVNVEQIYKYRLIVAEEESDRNRIEERINCGKIEQLILQANDELELIPKMAEWKPWEVDAEDTIEIKAKI